MNLSANAMKKWLAAAVVLVSTALHAQGIVSEDFTSSATTNSWYFFNGACLTAGTAAATKNPGQIPSCLSLQSSYYGQNLVGGYSGYLGSSSPPGSLSSGTPDPAATASSPGQGALRFTNGWPGGYNQNGAIVSASTYSTGQGVQITFKTVTYRGDSGGGGQDGADGISFFLMDGGVDLTKYPGLGAYGGSLGYTCSNSNPPYDGLFGGYIGLGIDEYGNFLNGSSNSLNESGSVVTNGGNGDNTATGGLYQPGRIGLRGAGGISWLALTSAYGTSAGASSPYYPASLATTCSNGATYNTVTKCGSGGVPISQLAVQKTCMTGNLYNYSTPASPVSVGTATLDNPVNTAKTLDYAAIPGAYSVLDPTLVQIANESAVTRLDGIPILYNLKITQDGLLSFAYSVNGGAYQTVIDQRSITTANGPLPGSFRFGFAGSTGGSTNIHEIMCFRAAPATQSSSSTGVNEKQSAKLQEGIQAYFAYYNPNNWSGRLTANGIAVQSDGTVIVAPLATWDASCVLTGVASTDQCLTTQVNGPLTAQSPSGRVIMSWNGATGIPFQFTSLSPSQQAALDAGDATQTANRLLYLRGDRSNEVNSAGVGMYRARAGVLGDILDSSPTWVGPPQSPYTQYWKDRLNPTSAAPENTGTQNYIQFARTGQTRLNVVYAGANDGMLHGFRTGSFDTSNAYVKTYNDGQEVLAYVPGAAVNSIHSATNATVDFSNTQYGHQFFVDGSPGTGDLFYNGKWHTWLVGGMGPGGAAIYALDITDPSPTAFAESNAASIVIGEWTSGNDATGGAIKCSGVIDCARNLGKTYGVPQIRRFHNGQWGAVFGNGLGSATGDAGIYVLTVDPATAAKTFYYLTTGTGTMALPGGDGISNVAPTDLDGDHITDYVYAGDTKGNVWRFDLTSSDPTKWAVSPGPLFTTQAGQPITTRIIVASGPSTSGGQRLILAFGTGQKTPITNTSPVTYSSGMQDLYGVWDWNLSGWNAMSAVKYASLPATNAATGLTAPKFTVAKANLTQQTITIDPVTKNRDITSMAAVCYKGDSGCSTGSFGWYLDLPGTSSQGGEQVVYDPLLVGGAFVVNATVPADNVPTSCSSNTDTGFTYAVSMMSGGGITKFFKQYNDTTVTTTGGAIAGVQTDATGTSFPVTTGTGATWLVYQTVLNAHQTMQVNLPANTSAKRLTWVELR